MWTCVCGHVHVDMCMWTCVCGHVHVDMCMWYLFIDILGQGVIVHRYGHVLHTILLLKDDVMESIESSCRHVVGLDGEEERGGGRGGERGGGG